MFRPLRRLRPVVAPPIAVVMAALALAVPLLDSGSHGATPTVQTEGHATGYLAHDHSICVQHGASPWSAAAETQAPALVLVRETVEAPAARRFATRLRLTSFQPRAPPIA